MAQSKVKYPASLYKYYMINTSWGNEEGNEGEKLVYYWSEKGAATQKEQLDDCGLAQGVIHFVNNFSFDEKENRDREEGKVSSENICESIHGVKTRVVLHRVENDFWSVMCLNVPHSLLKSGSDDGQTIVEYHQEEVNDVLIRRVMDNVYKQVRLLVGPLHDLWNGKADKNREVFRNECAKFLDAIIPQLKLSPINLIHTYSAIHYLPLDHITFMSAQSFLHHVTCIDHQLILHSMFLYNDQLVSSSLTLADTRVVYSYLTSTVIPDVICDEVSGQETSRTRWIKKNVTVYLHESQRKVYTMSLYRSINGATVVLFLKKKITQEEDNEDEMTESSREDLLCKCDALMSSRLPALSSKCASIAIQINGSTNLSCESIPSESFKFVYFNSSNHAYKSNISSLFDVRKFADAEFVQLVTDIESDMSETVGSENVREMIGKTTHDSWLIVRHSDARTLYSLLNHKNANLIEASETVNSLVSKQFKNILFID